MLGINFDKARGAYLLDCLCGKKPIEPSDKKIGWTVDDCLCLAGACFLRAFNAGQLAEAPALATWKFSGCRTS